MTIHALIKRAFFAGYKKPWRWPPDADVAAWERVEFDSATGARLVGLWGGSTGGPARGAVVCAHPMVPEGKGYFLRGGQADLLRRAGWDVLLFDANGFGESPHGDFRFPLDIVAAGKALAARSRGLPIGLYGLSLGAGYGICACASDEHPFRAAFLEAPFTTLDEYWRSVSAVQYHTLRVLMRLMPKQAAQLRPVSRIAELRGVERLLLVHGTRDRYTPPSMGERLIAACPPSTRAELWVVPDAKHTQAQRVAGDAYVKRLLGFFDESLAIGPSSPTDHGAG